MAPKTPAAPETKNNDKLARNANPLCKCGHPKDIHIEICGACGIEGCRCDAFKAAKRPPRKGEGRPSKYDPKFCEAIVRFFDVPHSRIITIKTTGKNDYCKEEEKEVANALPFFSGFARKIGVVHDTLLEWKAKYPEFSVSFTRAKELQEEMLVANSLKGLYDSRYAVFASKNITKMRDKVELEHAIDDSFEKYQAMSPDELLQKVAKLLGK